MAARRWLVLGVLLLSGAQTVYWLGGGFLAYMFRNFFLEPGSPAIDERTRNAYLVLAWFVVNAMVLALYAERRSGLATWVMAGLQVGNLAYGLWLGIRNTSSYCFTDQSVGLLVQPLGAASALVLLYMIWRRFEGGATSTLPMLSMLVRWPIRSLPLAA